MERTIPRPRWWSLLAALAAAVLLAAMVPAALPAEAASPATFTTVSDTDGDFEDLCANGNPAVNCNIYYDKDFVWLNGGPTGASLPDGTYFFAIGEPGFQANVDGPKLLSSDSKADRTFTVANGVPSYNSAHDTDGDLVRAMPYDDTGNPGGVYIAAICDATANPVRPNDCKFDAFKIRSAPPPPNQVNAIFQGTKWLDADGDGEFDSDEDGIEDWEINIYSVDGGGTRTLLAGMPIKTDSNGDYFFQSPDVDEGTDEHFVVCEVQQAGWRQTGPTAAGFADAAASATGGAVVTSAVDANDDELCYDVTTDGDSNATASLLDFWNIPAVDLTGAKYFDADESGHRNSEDGIEGWPIVIADEDDNVVCELETDEDGNWSSEDCDPPLVPGTYKVYEVQATNTDIWTQTGNVAPDGEQWDDDGDNLVSLSNFVYTVELPGDTTAGVSGLYFGNFCVLRDTPGGRTIGFWGNKNGQDLIGNDDIAALVALNLKYNDGITEFNPTTKGAVKTFLRDATSNGTGVHMLSAQLLATKLNTMNAHGGLDPITDPNFVLQWTVGGVTTTQSIADWIADADAYLGAGQFGDKSITTDYKDLFDAINNQHSFVTGDGSPETCEAPEFPTAE